VRPGAGPGRPLSGQEVLRLWEAGQDQDSLDRALTILVALCPGLTPAAAAALPIGERDGRLLSLHGQSFGPTLNAFADCPRCAERLEITLPLDRLRTPPGPPPDVVEGEGARAQPRWSLTLGELELRFRLPNSLDLRWAASRPDVASARRLLFERCVVGATSRGQPIGPDTLPDEVVERLSERMAACDPRAEVLLEMGCPACGHGWSALLDVGAFFWTELSALARRLLREVDALARVYHWTEAEILSLSARRRRWYLELAGV
jgi:hypothetical protein